jgi:LruC domain-containing protein
MKRSILFLLAGIMVSSCVEVLNHKQDNVTDLESLQIPDYFNYVTTLDFRVALKVEDNGGKALTGVPFSYGYKSESGFMNLGTFQTNTGGEALIVNRLPDFVDSLFVRTDYLGLPSETGFVIQSGDNQLLIGGVTIPTTTSSVVNAVPNARTANAKFSFLSPFDAQGVPNNLQPVNEYIPQDLLDLVNNSLPERRPVPQYNPEYIAENINSDTRFKELADVWITFVHEGAGWRNSLGYYTYDLDNPPTTAAEITNHYIIFPNVSLTGSGGNLAPGNKVYLGRFPANTGIGWFLVPDAWNGITVLDKAQIKYSNKKLNTFTTAAQSAHVATLKDDVREIVLLGIEDTSRPGGDNDFNDAVFFISANPYRAVITENVADAKAATGTDTDGDNVLDKNDLYPTDPNRAFNVFAPAENVFGTLAFEDMWPEKGDYDMNDIVVDYNFKAITNVANEVTELQGSFRMRALGASFQNGLGFELPIAPDKIASVSHDKFRNGSITLAANGTEDGQDKAVIVLFENSHELFGNAGMVNTQINQPSKATVQLACSIKFVTPIKQADLGYAPFNPFIFVNQRSVEVHLPGMPPTSKADLTLLGSKADSSQPLDARYYKSGDNLPWAINLPLPFDYPVESQPINKAHLRFNEWAKSGGSLSKDWYKNVSGYRLAEFIYK